MSSEEPADLVNTFIGTKGEGNTFPGASMPFGMAHSSPIGSHYSGWHYDDPLIRGFGHFFLSGAGCAQQGGLVSVLPTTAPSGYKPAFAIHEPIGLHYLMAISVAEEAKVPLLALDPQPQIRPVSNQELDTLTHDLERLDPDLFGIGILRYQVAPSL